MKNANLHAAKVNKNDEFYTQLSDIEKELKNYSYFFKDKVVYCNCDDCFESNFFKYFALNFNRLGLKKLITTCYAESKVAFTRYNLFGEDEEVADNKKKAYKIVLDKMVDYNNDGVVDMDDVEFLLKNNPNNIITELSGNGDFRSEECIELLKSCDVVVTNPPFSLFREFVATMQKYDKKFAVIGSMNAITYKEIFPIIKNNNLWLGYNYVKEFVSPNGEVKKFGNILWFTNIPIEKRKEKLIPDLYKKYNEKDYPKYDNYCAWNVDKVSDIPMDTYFDMIVSENDYISIKSVYGENCEILEVIQVDE